MLSVTPALAQSAPDAAQGEFIVDVSDPNVSIDLSVLDDGGGISARTGQPGIVTVSPTLSGSETLYQVPDADAPVSVLYVQPEERFILPQQTKTLIAEPVAESTVAEDAPSELDAQPEDSLTQSTPETVSESVAEAAPETVAAPAAPEPAPSAPQETAKAEPAPAPAAQPAPEEVMPEKTAVAPTVEAPEPVAAPAPAAPPVPAQAPAQAPTPAPTPAKPVETAVAQPEPAPAPPTVAAPVAPPPVAPPPVAALPVAPPPPVAEAPKAETVPEAAPQPQTPPAANAGLTPPPPPQALSKAPTEAPAAIDETRTAPKATPSAPKSGAVVVDLPPKLEETNSGVASLPSPTGTLADGDNMRIVFDNDSSKLPSDARDALRNLSDRMAKQPDLRLQLLAYAGDADTSASAARRLSLSRALAVRSYLIESGVRSTRIDVRALGNKSTETVTERVDITVVER